MTEVLKSLALIGLTYKGERAHVHEQVVMRLLRATYLSVAEHKELLTSAGIADVETFEHTSQAWLCCVARRPA